MELVFSVSMVERAEFLQQMKQSFGLTYICLWRPHGSKWLQGLDGVYEEKPSSSSRTLAGQLFSVYQCSEIDLDAGRVPGLAFRSNNSYMELRLSQLANLAYAEVQLQFYQAAGIKTVVFMGCSMGEIELGMPNEPQIDLQKRVDNMLQQDFLQRVMSGGFQPSVLPASSSSSSLKSFDSTDYSPLLPTAPPSFNIQEPLMAESSPLEEAIRAATSFQPTVCSPHHQAINQIRDLRLPARETEEAAITSAILAVLSSSSPQTSQNLPQINLTRPNPSAFRQYRHSLGPKTAKTRKQTMFNRSIYYLNVMANVRKQELQMQGAGNPRPMTAQSWQHMMKERTRRRKITDMLQILRSALPPGSKKDKASVLISTTEYLSSLKTQVAELTKRNQLLESQLAIRMPEASSELVERVSVEIAQVSSSSSSEGRFLDLRVTVREECSMLDLVIGLLGFLKQQRSLSLLCMESSFRMSESDTPMHGIMLRLRITEVDEFDEGGFQEAVKRVVEDQLH